MSDKWSNPSMMLVKSKMQSMDSFSLIPVSNDCPFIEAMYNPVAKLLAIIGKTKKDVFHTVPRLDEKGDPIKRKVVGKGGVDFKTQRITQESYTEYYITDRKDIENFLESFSVNHKDFEYKKILDIKTMENASDSNIAKGSGIIM